jgi:hypothetical protein
MLKSHYSVKERDVNSPISNRMLEIKPDLHRESRNKIFNKCDYVKSLRSKSYEDLTQEIEKVTGKSLKKLEKSRPNKTFEQGLMTIHAWRKDGEKRLSQTIEKESKMISKIKTFTRLRTAMSKTIQPRIKYIQNMRLKKVKINETNFNSQIMLTPSYHSMIFKKII